MSKAFLGIDTSMYTTSAAVLDEEGRILFEERRLLEVPPGKRGLQQSAAVFAHIRALPEILEGVRGLSLDLAAVAYSGKPRPLPDSYMPVFKAGEASARSIAAVLEIPAYPVSHQENHLGAALWSEKMDLQEPVLFLHLSGGTTEILRAEPRKDGRGFSMTLLGCSQDISAGQLLDRIGVSMGLPFPAGPFMEELSRNWREGQVGNPPNPLKVCEKNGNLFFSGLETRLSKILSQGQMEPGEAAAHLEDIIARSLLQGIGRARQSSPVETIIIAGGVAANLRIREILQKELPADVLVFPDARYCGDHALGAAYLAKRMYEKS